jgi:dipeptidyl aminopeptidase/acylaminoacyl peptidase
MTSLKFKIHRGAVYVPFVLLLLLTSLSFAGGVLTPQDVWSIKTCSSAEISPNGKWIAYTVSVPREANDEPGGAYSELYVISLETGNIRPFITGKVNIGSPRWSPDSSKIAFLTDRGEKASTQVWIIPVDGGEAFQATRAETSVSDFRWHPSGEKIAYIATTPSSKREKELDKKGYGFIFFEENLKPRNLYLAPLAGDKPAEQLTDGITVWSFEFSPDGRSIAAAVSPKNLVDQSYMFQKIHLLDLETKRLTRLTDNPGKLGNFAFSPDGSKLVYTAGLERKDHAVSQVFVLPVGGGAAKNLTPPDFRGHISWASWKDNGTVLYLAGEGAWPTLSLASDSGGQRKIILNARDSGIIFGPPRFTDDFKKFVLTGNTPNIPGELYYWEAGQEPKRITALNPWLAERQLGKQEVIKYKARDGQEIEGLLLYPVNYTPGARYPFVVTVHGGPESHYSNGWVTRYSEPGQALAGKGYAVFYPNYRSSTGYGLKFAWTGYNDAAGVEFDDIAAGIEHFIKSGIADPERVGLIGGSYGGFAAAWFSSYYTKLVKAVCMFVGISDLISKRGTTDIPYEELYVHSGKPLEEMWDQSLKRSPIYWAHQSKTAVLIMGGTADTRVHPSQSLEYYRILKMNNHPAVRLVQYPGEGHGNRRQPGRIDSLFRQIQWLDWYVKDKKPLDGPMPPLDISESYGLNLDN